MSRKFPFSFVYRLQLNQEFPLHKAIALIPYLKKLGVDGVYLSPVFKSGSTHGYDIVDPTQIHPLIGTEDEFSAFCSALKKRRMGLLLDIVPNHMGIARGENPWWQDVLLLGPFSFYAPFFDIDWQPQSASLKGKVLFPILGSPYGEVLKERRIQLLYKQGVFSLAADAFPLPVAPHSYPYLLSYFTPKKDASLTELCSCHLEGERPDLDLLYEKVDDLLKTGIKHKLADFNKDPQKLHTLLELQFYRLSHWKVANHELNYRRFFNIHELVGLRMEEPIVFEMWHKKVFQWVREKKVQALRIDHPDGLYDPQEYFRQLKERVELPLFIEKILEPGEKLPGKWEIEGTVGYEGLYVTDALFVESSHADQFTKIYERFIKDQRPYDEILFQSKWEFGKSSMASEVEQLAYLLSKLTDETWEYRDFTRIDLTHALESVLAAFPVYRTYICPKGKVSAADKEVIEHAIISARSHSEHLDPTLFDFFRDLLLMKLPLPRAKKKAFRHFILKFQQLTGPLMAKGLEDTAFYRYNRLLSLNEVGGNPQTFGLDPREFHRFCQEKRKHHPYGMFTSSTHDTKRSLDARMRLHVLSQIPHKWERALESWQKMLKNHGVFIHPKDEYTIYQTLVAVYPAQMEPENHLCGRVWEVIVKSVREGKERSSWISPNIEYEERIREFLTKLFTYAPFFKAFSAFLKDVDTLSTQTTLSYLALQFGAPGVVDLYQGGEVENRRLVDPDNRHNVNFEYREKLMQRPSSHEKFNYVHIMGKMRQKDPELFLEGNYEPVEVENSDVIAYLRSYKERTLLVIARRFLKRPVRGEIILPRNIEGRDLFLDKRVAWKKGRHNIKQILGKRACLWIYERA